MSCPVHEVSRPWSVPSMKCPVHKVHEVQLSNNCFVYDIKWLAFNLITPFHFSFAFPLSPIEITTWQDWKLTCCGLILPKNWLKLKAGAILCSLETQFNLKSFAWTLVLNVWTWYHMWTLIILSINAWYLIKVNLYRVWPPRNFK